MLRCYKWLPRRRGRRADRFGQSLVEVGERVGSEKPIVGLCGFCFSTLYPAEGFPVVLLEAIVFRLSVVSTKWRGIPEIVDAGETGLLVETGVDRFEADRVAAELAEYL